jgi:hypothetical protein
MTLQKNILKNLDSISSSFNWKSPEHRLCLMKMMIKAADIGTEVRPLSVSKRWVSRLFSEFFFQGDLEKKLNLSKIFMDRDKVKIPEEQVFFIQNVLLPVYVSLLSIFGAPFQHYVEQIKISLEYWKNNANEVIEISI